jgi:ribose transport system substrate-binding protein
LGVALNADSGNITAGSSHIFEASKMRRLLLFFLFSMACINVWAEQALQLAFIPKGGPQVFWREVARGAVDEATALGIRLVWRGPANEDGVDAQSRIMQIYTESGFDGIILAPNSTTELAQQIDATLAKGIKVVIVDSPLESNDSLPYVGTNNLSAGALAARQLAKDFPKTRRILVYRYAKQHGSTTARETGFIQANHKLLPTAKVVDTYFSGVTRVDAQARLENLLAKDNQFDAVFTPNESGTEGANAALRKLKLTGRVHHYGFDYTAQIEAGLKDRSLSCVVIQDPYQMGRKSTALMRDTLQNPNAPKSIETPAVMVTRGNMDADSIRAITDPFVKMARR